MMDKNNEILLECKDGIALLTLNRGAKMNAFSDQMRAQYLEALDEVTTNRSIVHVYQNEDHSKSMNTVFKDSVFF